MDREDPGPRIILRDEPLHPRYRQRATERGKKLGRRYQLIATDTQAGQIGWLDGRHRSHVHVENYVKQAKAVVGLNRWPSPARLTYSATVTCCLSKAT